jgi:uncharacterized membrane protein
MEENKQEQRPEAEMAQERETNAENDIRDNKVLALLSYLGILVIIPLLVKKDSPFVQFHAKQGLVLLIGWVVSWFPVFGWIIGIIVFVLSIIGIINVLNGERKNLPIVGDLAEKINL